MSGVVAIVGRPNVGKSTLFNRLTESRDAIVDEIAGVTRDRHYGSSNWNGKSFTVVDTGGYIVGSDDEFEEEIQRQVRLAVDEADVILFLVDVAVGITDMDETVADLLRRSRKPVILVVNKVDNSKRYEQAVEFYGLGLGEYITISSMNGSGTGELLDEVVKYVKAEEEEEQSDIPRIAIIGRPNVGKSSLTNALLGEDRNIVTPIAGTTRDAIGTRYNKFGHDLIFVDTAGLRKKAKVDEDLEFYSVLRTINAIEKSDVCLLLIDAKQGLESQDLNIMHLIIKNQKGVVLCVNKWDLIEKDTKTAKEYEERLRYQLAPFNDVPIMFTSVLNKQRIFQLVEKAVEVCESRKQKISTSKLNEILLPEIEAYPPPSVKGKYVKIKFITQLPTYAPQFAFFCSNPKYVREPYRRFLENKLRSHFNFTGVPIRIYMREK